MIWAPGCPRTPFYLNSGNIWAIILFHWFRVDDYGKVRKKLFQVFLWFLVGSHLAGAYEIVCNYNGLGRFRVSWREGGCVSHCSWEKHEKQIIKECNLFMEFHKTWKLWILWTILILEVWGSQNLDIPGEHWWLAICALLLKSWVSVKFLKIMGFSTCWLYH